MIERFSTQTNSDSATSAPGSNDGKATSNIGPKDQVNDRGTKFSEFPILWTGGGLDRIAERPEPPRPQPPGSLLRAKVTALAIAVGMLPVLAVGTATYYFGTRAITEQATQFRRAGTMGLVEAESMQQRQLQSLAGLLVGTGATALLSGTIAAFWANRSIRSATATAAATTAQEAGQARAVRTQLFTDAVYQIRASVNKADILKAAVEETRNVIGSDRVLVYSLDENSQGIVIAESVAQGWPKALKATIKDPCFGAKYIEKYQNGRVHAIDDIYKVNLGQCYLEQLEAFAVRANLVAPLLNEGKLIGLLIAHQCSGPRVWQQSEIDLFTQIATQVGFALDNAKLLAERASLQEQVDIETKWKEFFVDATRHIHASLNQEDVFKAAVEEARRVLASDRVLVYSVDRKSQGIVVAESVVPGWPRAFGVTIKDPCFEARYIEKYKNGRVKALNNIYEAGMTPCYIDQLETLAVKANLVAPIINEGKLIGLLVAHQCSGPRVWKQVEIRWFAQIATQVGFALDNVKLIRQVEQMSQEAEAVAHERRQEKAGLQHEILEILSNSEDALETFSKEASRQVEAVTVAISQIQALADYTRGITANAQKVELQVQQASQAVQAEHENVNRTVDSIAALRETVEDTAVNVKHLSQTAQNISQVVSLIKELAVQMNRQAINATIEAGRSGDDGQVSIVFIAEAVRSFTIELTRVTADIEPLLAELETQAITMAGAMDTGKEQVVAGIESTKETRQKLNQIATINVKISTLVSNMTEAAAGQAQISNCASQTVLEVANLANYTSEQSAAVAESFTKLAAVAQYLQTSAGLLKSN